MQIRDMPLINFRFMRLQLTVQLGQQHGNCDECSTLLSSFPVSIYVIRSVPVPGLTSCQATVLCQLDSNKFNDVQGAVSEWYCSSSSVLLGFSVRKKGFCS